MEWSDDLCIFPIGNDFNNEDYLLIAKDAADFCLSYLRKKDGTLLKRWISGHAALPAHLDDYAFLSQGLLDLFEASFEEKYLRTAIELIDLALFHFEDNQGGGFFCPQNRARNF